MCGEGLLSNPAMFAAEPCNVFDMAEEYLAIAQHQAFRPEDLMEHFLALFHMLLPHWLDLTEDVRNGSSPANFRLILGHMRRRFAALDPPRENLPPGVVPLHLCQPPHLLRITAAVDDSARRRRFLGSAALDGKDDEDQVRQVKTVGETRRLNRAHFFSGGGPSATLAGIHCGRPHTSHVCGKYAEGASSPNPQV